MKTSDRADVLVRPPLLYAGSLILAVVLQRVWPAPALGGQSTFWAGILLLGADAGLLLWGRRALLAANTTANPALPTRTVVTSGPFRFSRNPLYVSLTLMYLDFMLITRAWWWSIAIMCPVLIVMHRAVVLREERYLERKFGDVYRRYRLSVPRYL